MGLLLLFVQFFLLLNILVAVVIVAFILNGIAIFFALIQYLFSQTICLLAPSTVCAQLMTWPEDGVIQFLKDINIMFRPCFDSFL